MFPFDHGTRKSRKFVVLGALQIMPMVAGAGVHAGLASELYQSNQFILSL